MLDQNFDTLMCMVKDLNPIEVKIVFYENFQVLENIVFMLDLAKSWLNDQVMVIIREQSEMLIYSAILKV